MRIADFYDYNLHVAYYCKRSWAMTFKYQDLKQGFSFISAEQYINDIDSRASLAKINHLYETELQVDGPRKRAYLKLEWERATQKLTVSQNQNYFQTAASNQADGGKTRQFAVMDTSILALPLMQNLLKHNLNIIAGYEPLNAHDSLTLGLHFIQYLADKNCASYSSPVGLHMDDEPLVFVHLVELSNNALGGDNLIASLGNQEITSVIRLEQPMDTILLNRNCYHAVTPLGSRVGKAIRNIILFTIEPAHTQVAA